MKKQTFKLEVDNEEELFKGIAFLFFHTATPNYAFADDLNRLYRLSLSRKTDLELLSSNWPLYSYNDLMRQIDYYLIERPQTADTRAPHWGTGHKLLLLKGQNTAERASEIYDDFSTPNHAPVDEGDPQAALHAAILAEYQQNLTPVDLYNPANNTVETPPSRKAAKERADMETLLASLLDLLDLSGN